MSKHSPNNTPSFEAIEPEALADVAGGAARSGSSKSSSEVTAALTAIQSSLKDLAGNKNQGMDPMQMILMMMMIGGGGGGGVVAGAAHPSPPVINVETGVVGGGGGCGRRGKKGW
jgi:hypothetical protein